MQEFKKGDLLERIQSWGFGEHKLGTQAVVEKVKLSSKNVCFKGDPHEYHMDSYKLVPPTYPNPPHKHAEVIKAWADGAEIESRSKNEAFFSANKDPVWNPNVEYRIKPQKSDKELQIEKLEQQARELADEISKLKE